MEGELIIGGECARGCGDTRAAEGKNFSAAWIDERAETVERPSGPPQSGWVQPYAAANPACRRGLQSTRPAGRVAELGTLGDTRRFYENDLPHHQGGRLLVRHFSWFHHSRVLPDAKLGAFLA